MTVVPMTDRSPSQELVEWVRQDDRRDQIAKALPEGVALDRFERATATALVANPDLANADRQSLYLAILSAAQRGLVPDGRQGVINVYRTKVKTDQGEEWIQKAQFLPMIGGVRDTLAEYGWMLKTACVYENDEFQIDEANGTVSHRPARLGTDRGPLVGAYAVARHKGGHQQMALSMPKADIDEVRAKASKGNNKAWEEWYSRMAEKTCGHRLAKQVPLAPQDRRRVDWIFATEIEPGDAAAALYGAPAEPTFSELPAGATAADQLPPASTQEVEGGAAHEPSSGDAATSGGSTPQPDTLGTDGQGAAATPTDEQVMLAADAAEYVLTTGRFSANCKEGEPGPTPLQQIGESEDGQKYLGMLLRQLGEGENRQQVEAFIQVRLPDVWAEHLEKQKAA